MNYIIDPSWIYWMNTLASIQFMMGIVAFVAAIVMLICFFVEWKFDKPCIICSIIVVIGLLGGTFIPSKTTMMEMLAAKVMTVENLQMGKEAVLELIREIVEVVGK